MYIDMNKKINFLAGRLFRLTLVAMVIFLGACEKFFDPDQDLIIKEDDFFKDWYDYRAAEMGMYSLMQELSEQILILGELRADLMEVTEFADRDLLEIYNFEISPQNIYASPRNFYTLIAACNNLQRTLEHYHPEVLDPDANITNYDKLYGEVIVMRSWAFFNAVRIYGKVPWVPSSLTSIEEIVDFVNSSKTIYDPYDIIFHPDGTHNDTIWYDEPKELENAYLGLSDIVDSCTYQIETKVKATGVEHYLDNLDYSWFASVWNPYAAYYLLGQMYMFQGDLFKAMSYFNPILNINDPEASTIMYGLDRSFAYSSWKNILTSININEHIFVIWFGKSKRQTNDFQKLFSVVPPNQYQLKPTIQAVHNWETIWDGTRLTYYPAPPSNPADQTLRLGYEGSPGDFYRGHRVSYCYIRNELQLDNAYVREMLELKRDQNDFEVEKKMEDVDTVIYKYTVGNEYDPFAHDANLIIARAAGVHLYAAEIYTYWAWNDIGGGNYQPVVTRAEQFLNDGSYAGNGDQLGVRGRVGFSDGYEKILVPDIIYNHDPFTNEVLGYTSMAGNLTQKQRYMEEQVLNERARELAYEGERFYDLMRVAKRRGENSFLADMVASKFTDPGQAEQIRQKLMDENNWYLPFYLGSE